jgi:hypothetical protein
MSSFTNHCVDHSDLQAVAVQLYHNCNSNKNLLLLLCCAVYILQQQKHKKNGQHTRHALHAVTRMQSKTALHPFTAGCSTRSGVA